MEATHIAILQDTLKYLQMEWENNGTIEIYFCVIGNIHLCDNTIESVACSCINTQWDEGIYYEPTRDLFFFYGEPRGHTFGGNKTEFFITSELSHLLTPELKAMLRQVAEKQESIIIKWRENEKLLEN
jgi:hypothetical protein